MISIKRGVKLAGLRPEMVLAISIIEALYGALGLPLVITSGLEGKHRPGSLHYVGLALGCRTKIVPRDKLLRLRDECIASLGAEYDVILEAIGEPNEHMHVEFQPKE